MTTFYVSTGIQSLSANICKRDINIEEHTAGTGELRLVSHEKEGLIKWIE